MLQFSYEVHKGEKMIQVIQASTVGDLQAALDLARKCDQLPSITVEAEYGDEVVEGDLLTLAHHGSRAGRPAPCLYAGETFAGLSLAIGVSHIDLDTLGGIAHVLGRDHVLGRYYEHIEVVAGALMPFADFWRVAAYVDVHGLHKIAEAPGFGVRVEEQLQAWYAWSADNSCPRGTGAVTEYVTTALSILEEILTESTEPVVYGHYDAPDTVFDPPHRQAGRDWLAARRAMADAAFIGEDERVRTYIGPGFYSWDYQRNTIAIVTLNDCTHAITIAVEDGGKAFDAARLLQDMFGSEAGGRPGMAGTPRGGRYTREDLSRVVARVHLALRVQFEFVLDRCENVPFAGIGGQAGPYHAPEYIEADERDAYITFYKRLAAAEYGADWAVQQWGWTPALKL